MQHGVSVNAFVSESRRPGGRTARARRSTLSRKSWPGVRGRVRVDRRRRLSSRTGFSSALALGATAAGIGRLPHLGAGAEHGRGEGASKPCWRILRAELELEPMKPGGHCVGQALHHARTSSRGGAHTRPARRAAGRSASPPTRPCSIHPASATPRPTTNMSSPERKTLRPVNTGARQPTTQCGCPSRATKRRHDRGAPSHRRGDGNRRDQCADSGRGARDSTLRAAETCAVRRCQARILHLLSEHPRRRLAMTSVASACADSDAHALGFVNQRQLITFGFPA
mgnify:CR=1 FL=1